METERLSDEPGGYGDDDLPSHRDFVGSIQSARGRVDLFAYVDATDFSEYLGISGDLNLRIMDIVAESGTGFAFPSNTTYVAKDDGIDAEKARRAEAIVQRWEEREELYLPGFPEKHVEALRESIEYPRKGAPAGVTQ